MPNGTVRITLSMAWSPVRLFCDPTGTLAFPREPSGHPPCCYRFQMPGCTPICAAWISASAAAWPQDCGQNPPAASGPRFAAAPLGGFKRPTKWRKLAIGGFLFRSTPFHQRGSRQVTAGTQQCSPLIRACWAQTDAPESICRTGCRGIAGPGVDSGRGPRKHLGGHSPPEALWPKAGEAIAALTISLQIRVALEIARKPPG